MANEATLVYETSVPIPFTVADGTAIPKGSIMEFGDNFNASITNGDGDKTAGVAAEEKVANDGKTTIGVYMSGIFRGSCGAGGVTVGHAIQTDTATGAANELVDADVNTEHVVGRALETATDGQTFMFELKPMHYNLA